MAHNALIQILAPVAAQIDQDEDFQSELERLSTSFGIGIIHIDVDDPDSTSILFSAKLNSIDWETVNKLASMNPDFSSFDVGKFQQLGPGVFIAKVSGDNNFLNLLERDFH